MRSSRFAATASSLALGQSPDLSIFPEGRTSSDGENAAGLTQRPVFAGGDFATNDGTVTAAIGSGAGGAAHSPTLTGEDLFPPEPPEVAGPEEITLHLFARSRGSRA
jgi:hypothetical protein